MNINVLNSKNRRDTGSRIQVSGTTDDNATTGNVLPEILFVTTYPPRECGIATYSRDLIAALENKFNNAFRITVCAIESETEQFYYPDDVKYRLNTDEAMDFDAVAYNINNDAAIRIVLIQHEFGLFKNNEKKFRAFLDTVSKPIIMVFHTILPHPNELLLSSVTQIAEAAQCIIVMTNSSAEILATDYDISPDKIAVIPHGTHLVPHADKNTLKEKYQMSGRKVLATFGLLSAGKSIETTLDALPAIVKNDETVLFLIIGKTHPTIVKYDGEAYREMLLAKVNELGLGDNVRFINEFLPLPALLEYLQLTDIYLFTSNDPHQAVSGTFAYAISCGCPVISTPIPHAREVLRADTGIIIDFNNPTQLAEVVNSLMGDEQRRRNMVSNGLHRMASTAWENAAIAHALLFEKNSIVPIVLNYSIPEIKFDHIRKMTTDFGMIQFSKLNEPDIESGYTLDDNARAMIAMCQQYELTKDEECITYIGTYLNFIKYCQQRDGHFKNYVNVTLQYTLQNDHSNLADSNGRAIWALGYLVSLVDVLPADMVLEADIMIHKAVVNIERIHATRAMAFVVKGLHYYNMSREDASFTEVIKLLADRMVQMYKHEASAEWNWYESYLTYGNSLLPEAMLCAWLATGNREYKSIAKASFDFLLSRTFSGNTLKAISNKSWLTRDCEYKLLPEGGEQPIEIAYTILALDKFTQVFGGRVYADKLQKAFSWFLGNNHLHQIIYNPCTGGCYDGLEESYVNLNQGAESTLSYMMSRLIVEKNNKTARVQYQNRETSNIAVLEPEYS
jgi:glycosyltransferase involved in cell wall biosynthesis